MKTIIRNLLAAMFVAVSLQTSAQSLVYDQQSATSPLSPFGNDFFDLQEDSPLTQSFIPILSAIGFVQFEFADFSGNGNNGATVYVNLWTGSPNTNSATFLGSTAPVYMPNAFGFPSIGVTNFYFSTPVTLTPGQTYYLQPVVASGDDPWDIMVLTNTYPNGKLFASGLALQPGSDFWFREGVVPEPSALALVGLSSLLAFSFKRRPKLFALLLFAISIHSVRASDSIVQATADAAGLTPVSSTSVPSTGTFWVMTTGSDGDLVELPYPFLPPSFSALPIYSAGGDKFIVDDTGGQLLPSSAKRMSSAQAASAALSQSQTMTDLIGQMLNPDDDETFQPNFTFMLNTNGLWLEASNEPPYLGIRAHNTTIGDNYQLLFTTNLESSWNLGQILNASDIQMNFTPVPRTNSMMFYLAHHANPVMKIESTQPSQEPSPTNSDPGQVGLIYISNEGLATNDVTVYYSVSGTAMNGVDYTNLPGVATVLLSQGYAEIDIAPIADGLKPDQTVILTLTQNTNYLIDPALASATNTLQANPQVYPIAFGDREPVCPNTLSPLQLNANDPNVIYTILTWPTHGTLITNDIPTVYYTATNCYEGQDSFTFKVNDGQYDSAPATVTLIIASSVFSYPVYRVTSRGAPVAFTFNGGDACENTNFALISYPAAGTLSGTSPSLTYTPNSTNFTGVDSFVYAAVDGCGDAATNAVNILSVPGPALFTQCDPFGTAVSLDWSLDGAVQLAEDQYDLGISDFIVYRSGVSGGPYTAIATNYYTGDASWMSYFDASAVVGQTYYYVVTFEFTANGNSYESPLSNQIQASGQNPDDLIPPNAFWNVMTNLSSPTNVMRLQAPFSSFGTNQYPGVYPLPTTFWPESTTWSNQITLYIPTNSVPLAQVKYSIIIDNDYKLYLNNSASYIDMTNHGGPPIWAAFQSFPTNLLHYGTNDIRVWIKDDAGPNYFSMVVTTNTCGR